MPLLPTKTTLRAVLCCSAAVFAVSCVNEDYDLSKEIDKKINISGDFSAPLGDSELIQIGEFLNLDKDDQDVLKTDANGDYYVQVIGNGSATGFYVRLLLSMMLSLRMAVSERLWTAMIL